MKLSSFRAATDLDFGQSGRSEFRVGENGILSIESHEQYLEVDVKDKRGRRKVIVPWVNVKWALGVTDAENRDSGANDQGAVATGKRAAKP